MSPESIPLTELQRSLTRSIPSDEDVPETSHKRRRPPPQSEAEKDLRQRFAKVLNVNHKLRSTNKTRANEAKAANEEMMNLRRAYADLHTRLEAHIKAVTARDPMDTLPEAEVDHLRQRTSQIRSDLDDIEKSVDSLRQSLAGPTETVASLFVPRVEYERMVHELREEVQASRRIPTDQGDGTLFREFGAFRDSTAQKQDEFERDIQSVLVWCQDLENLIKSLPSQAFSPEECHYISRLISTGLAKNPESASVPALTEESFQVFTTNLRAELEEKIRNEVQAVQTSVSAQQAISPPAAAPIEERFQTFTDGLRAELSKQIHDEVQRSYTSAQPATSAPDGAIIAQGFDSLKTSLREDLRDEFHRALRTPVTSGGDQPNGFVTAEGLEHLKTQLQSELLGSLPKQVEHAYAGEKGLLVSTQKAFIEEQEKEIAQMIQNCQEWFAAQTETFVGIQRGMDDLKTQIV